MDGNSKPAPATGQAAPRWTLPRLPLLLGVIGLGAVVTTGIAVSRRADARQQTEARAIRADVASRQDGVEEYRERFRNLQWQARRIREAEDAAAGPLDAWSRERGRLFDALVARIDRSAEEKRFATLSREIEANCAAGDLAAARERLRRLPAVTFPAPAEFRRWQAETYLKPLAELSRENPGYYRAFQRHEPEAAAEDIAALRRELAGADLGAMTPQSMLKFELLSAVAAPDDPLLADWAAVASAEDDFERPDAATLARWRQAQRAVRAQDWPRAVAEMQAIARTAVRTRQPFRAAFGRALFKNRPDQPAAAYPFFEEAAAAGDRKARAWVAEQDYAQGRYAAAVPWLETAVADGEAAAVPRLLALYAMKPGVAPRDAAREAGVLQRIVVTPDAPPLSAMLLARLYEEGDGVAASAAKAFAGYRRAAAQQFKPAWPEVARCYLHGVGTPVDPDQALDWACRAFAAGEREKSVPLLIELTKRDPDRAANAVEALFERVSVAAPAGFDDTRTGATGWKPLQMELARYFDRKGDFGRAARLYAQSGSRDPAVVSRRAELTAAHPCATCGGTGKIRSSTTCATCGGRGMVVCHVCEGRGYSWVPGTPPCTICGGSGTRVQDGHVVACAACGGTGRGKGSVIKRDCPACVYGWVPCPDCVGGRIQITKECPDCHGTGVRSLADR